MHAVTLIEILGETAIPARSAPHQGLPFPASRARARASAHVSFVVSSIIYVSSITLFRVEGGEGGVLW